MVQELTELNEKTEENTAFVEDLGEFATNALNGVPANALDAMDDESGVYMTIRKVSIKAYTGPMLHKLPSMHSEIIDHVEAGEYIVMEVSDNSWYKIQVANGKTGWIYGGKTTLEEIQFIPKEAADE